MIMERGEASVGLVIVHLPYRVALGITYNIVGEEVFPGGCDTAVKRGHPSDALDGDGRLAAEEPTFKVFEVCGKRHVSYIGLCSFQCNT